MPSPRPLQNSDPHETTLLLNDDIQVSISDTSSCNSHSEPHFANADVIRDIIIGLSDGLTVPFALAAGLASLNNSRLVVTAGFAEIIAGSISMGLGGYLAGRSEIEHYDAERARESNEVLTVPHREEKEIIEIFEPYGMKEQDIQPLMNVLRNNHETWVDFMMKFELGLERPDPSRSYIAALTISFSYLMGGLIPLLPYILIQDAIHALYVSAIITLIALFVFGYVKAILLGNKKRIASAIQTTIIGALAGGAAYGVAKFIPQESFL